MVELRLSPCNLSFEFTALWILLLWSMTSLRLGYCHFSFTLEAPRPTVQSTVFVRFLQHRGNTECPPEMALGSGVVVVGLHSILFTRVHLPMRFRKKCHGVYWCPCRNLRNIVLHAMQDVPKDVYCWKITSNDLWPVWNVLVFHY